MIYHLQINGDFYNTGTGGFFSNAVDGGGPIMRHNGRVFIGDGHLHNAATDGNVTGGSWLQSFASVGSVNPVENLDYVEDQARHSTVSTGRGAGSFASRTSGGDGAVYSLISFMNNDSPDGHKGGAVYFDAVKNHADAGDTFTVEVNCANLAGPVFAATPYKEMAFQGTSPLRIAAGSDAAVFGPSYAISTYAHFINNGAKAHSGIVFEHDALLRDDEVDAPGAANGAGYGRAMSLPANLGISWFSRGPLTDPGTQQEAVTLTSTVVSPNVRWRMSFDDGAFVVGDGVSPTYNALIVDYVPNAETGVAIVAGVAGSNATLAARGAASNINLALQPKGTGKVQFTQGLDDIGAPDLTDFTKVLTIVDGAGTEYHIPASPTLW